MERNSLQSEVWAVLEGEGVGLRLAAKGPVRDRHVGEI